MKTQSALLVGQVALAGLTLLLAGCSGSNSAVTGAAMYIEACSLGCGNGNAGDQISCSIVNIGPNSEIVLQFSQPVDLSSVDDDSLQVVNINNGTVPAGTYVLDESDPRRLIFRPEMTVDELGQPRFSFASYQTYQLTVPGTVQGDNGPYIRGKNGKANLTRMQCTLSTTEGLVDPVPGPPIADAFVTAGGVTYELGVDVIPPLSCSATVSLLFQDIINPGTIATDPSGGESTTILVKVDTDGDLNTKADQVIQAGTWELPERAAYNAKLQTLAVFTPEGGFPSAGAEGTSTPRLIVVSTSSDILDLVNNGLANPTDYSFRTLQRSFDAIELPAAGGESFENSAGREDTLESGGNWGSGRLTWEIGGGSGRLGQLWIRPGEEVVLDTDSQLFPIPIQSAETTPPGSYPGQLRSLLDNYDPNDPETGLGGDYDPRDPEDWPTITVTNGLFEFSSVIIESGGTLRFQGSNPARVFSRGQLLLDGTIDLVGGDAPDHVSNSGGDHASNPSDAQATKYGGVGGVGSLAAGDGGQGADRINMKDSPQPTTMKNVGGIVWVPEEEAVNVGRDGEGVGGTTASGGQGGEHWPSVLPMAMNMGTTGFGDLEISVLPENDSGGLVCGSAMVAGPGSGGAYALDGGAGLPVSPHPPAGNPGVYANTPDDTPGGDSSVLGIEPPGTETGLFLVRHLRADPPFNHLRGGSGGGGGGTHVFGSRLNTGGAPCLGGGGLFPFFDHSAAGGGGGGGAIELVAGRRMAIGGEIDCSGGNGGNSSNPEATLYHNCDHSGSTGGVPDCTEFASPGGGGSGGAIKLSSRVVDILAAPGLSVIGGFGGAGVGGSTGGDGSPGLVRIEHSNFVSAESDAIDFAPLVSPYYPPSGSPPPPPGFNDPFLSAAILSIGPWEDPQFRPATYCGTQSCWMQPTVDDVEGECGVIFDLAFAEDESDDELALHDTKGWNMKVRYSPPGGGETKEFWYRGQDSVDDPDNLLHGNDDYEHYLGLTLNHGLAANLGSLLTVRFQGARVKGSLDVASGEQCSQDLLYTDRVESGSLTPWVRHPSHLNYFAPRPNMIRYVVLFEPRLQGAGFIQGHITGVTDLVIEVNPN